MCGVLRGNGGDQHGAERRHPCRERDGALCALERAERFFEPGDTRLPEPLVDGGVAFAEVAAGGEVLVGVAARFDAGQRVGRRQIDHRNV